MSCTNCIQSTASITGFSSSNCTNSQGCYTNATCVVYSGPKLNCSGILTNDSLDIMLQKIDPLLCAGSGDYSSYNTYCLAPITTQKQFVESISNFVCTLNASFLTFVNTTFPAYQATVTAALLAITSPGLTCASAGVTSGDSLNTILTKYCTKFGSIDAAINMAGVNWSSCYTVSPTPTTIVQGFNTLIAQICLLKSEVANAAVLPFFDNTSSCLTGGTNNDSLATTINLIKNRLCLTGAIDITTLTWGCTTQPSNNAQDLQGTLQAILTQLSAVTRAEPTVWSGDFTITNVDSTNLCLGKHVALSTPSTQDRFVASTTSDLSPGTLQDKVTAGTNITLDYLTTPGQMIINSSAGVGTGDHKVIADVSDATPNYLFFKLEAGTPTFGISVTPSLDATTDPTDHQVQLSVAVDLVTLFTSLLNVVSSNPALSTLFCSTVAGCPSPCAAPSNVIVTYNTGTTSTTTTTTTT